MSERDVRPTALMRQLDEDEAVVSSISKTARRVKIEENHTWNIRFLPVQMGPDKMPYVRLAQHWWNKAPITCPTFTPKGFGGNPEQACPICELSDRLNESPSKEIKDLGYSARCVLRFRFWCVVFDMEDARGRIDELPLNEVLNPYEFDMYKTTWEDFKKYQKWATTRRKDPSEWGLLDLETGCNLLATHGNKGVRLERSDPSPIFDLEDKNFDSYIQKIWERLRKPSIVIPSEKQLLETAIKIEEYAENGGRKGNRDEDDRGGSRRSSSRGGFRGRDDDRGSDRGNDRAGDRDEDDRGGSRRSRYSGEDNDADATPRTRRAAPEADAPAEDAAPVRSRRAAAPEPEQQQQPEEPAVPTRRSATASPLPTRRSAPQAEQQEEAPQEESAPPTRRGAVEAPAPARRQVEAKDQIADEDLQKDGSPDAPPTRKVAAAGPAPARRSAPAPAQEEAPQEEVQQEQPQRPPTRRTTAAAQSEPPIGEDEETVTDERKDQAPLVREKVEDVPPAVKADAPTPKRGNASDLQSRLARLTEKGK